MRARIRRALAVWIVAVCCATVALAGTPDDAHAARIKDVAHVHGVRPNQLIGYGIVVGLDGTGDVGRAALTVQTVSSMLSRFSIKIDERLLQPRNVAAVMVTAELPAFAQSGQRVDVTVSSLGNARSLTGGTLLMTPLMGADGRVYALGQGPISTGGYQVNGAGANSLVKNHLNAGRVPNGAMIERSTNVKLEGKSEIRLVLHEPDFSTAVRVATSISQTFGGGQASATGGQGAPQPVTGGIARALDPTTIVVEVPESFVDHVPQFIAAIEGLEVERDTVAKIVINERTGTIVLGGRVQVREVAVAHGNLNVNVSTIYNAAQPAPFSDTGRTAVLPDSQVAATEGSMGLHMVGPSASIGEVVSALNAIGVTPRDLIAILQAMKAAGALDAVIEIQ